MTGKHGNNSSVASHHFVYVNVHVYSQLNCVQLKFFDYNTSSNNGDHNKFLIDDNAHNMRGLCDDPIPTT